MRKREHWQVEAFLIGMVVFALIGLWLTRGTPDY